VRSYAFCTGQYKAYLRVCRPIDPCPKQGSSVVYGLALTCVVYADALDFRGEDCISSFLPN